MLNKCKNEHMRCSFVLMMLFAVQMLMHLNVDNIIQDDLVFLGALENTGGYWISFWLAGIHGPAE